MYYREYVLSGNGGRAYAVRAGGGLPNEKALLHIFHITFTSSTIFEPHEILKFQFELEDILSESKGFWIYSMDNQTAVVLHVAIFF